MNTILIILIAIIPVTAAFLGGCLGICKAGEKEGICKYDNVTDDDNDDDNENKF